MNIKNKKALCTALLLFTTALLCAMDWPSEDGKVAYNFGANRKGKPLLGIVFESEGAVRAVEDGEVLFTNIPGRGASRLPSPLGAWMALDHGDGLISIYSRKIRLSRQPGFRAGQWSKAFIFRSSIGRNAGG